MGVPACPHRPASSGVDRLGRLYVVWYTEGADETPAVYLAYSDDRGNLFGKAKLNVSKGTFPDHPQMAVDPEGRVVVVWEEQSPVRREVVMSVSTRSRRNVYHAAEIERKKRSDTHRSVNAKGLCAMAWMEHAHARSSDRDPDHCVAVVAVAGGETVSR